MAGDIDVELGRRLRKLRLDRSVSQSALADHLGISFQQVQKYESGSNRISVATFLNICCFFRVEPKQFLEGLVEAESTVDWAGPNGPDAFSNALVKIRDDRVRNLIERLALALSEMEIIAPAAKEKAHDRVKRRSL